MANILVSFCKNSQIITSVTNAIVRQSGVSFIKPIHGIRHLYSSTTLGIDNYLQQRERTKGQLSNIAARFREKMLEYSTDDCKNMVFTEDLKNMLHLAEGDDDVKVLIKMMKRFNQQNKQMRFGSFVFGPVAMRMFHFLNKPEDALQCFKDEDLDGLFDQIMSYQILLDLLFENQKYDDILIAFEHIKSKQIEGIKYAKNVIVLVFASCFKLNTKESLQYALQLWSELTNIGHAPMRRAITFCAALAINQGKPDAALEILSISKNTNYTTIRNLKASAFVDIGRIEEAIALLKSIITEDKAFSGMTQTFNRDIIDKIKAAVEKSGNSDSKLEFNRVLKYLQEQGQISEQTIDFQLCQEIATPPQIGKRTNENLNFTRYQPQYSRFNRDADGNRPDQQQRTFSGRFSRPGLADLQ